MNTVVDNTYKKITLFFGAIIAILSFPLSMFFSGKWEVKTLVKLYSTEQLKLDFPDFSQSPNGNQFIEFMIQNALDPIGFRYYSVCLFFGLIFGFWLMLKFLPRIGLKIGQVERMFVELLLVGLFGSRIGYVVGHFQYFQSKPFEILNVQQGGLSLFGGLFFCFLYLALIHRRLKVGILQLTDHLIPATLGVMIFSRFGNFFNYESYGPKTDLGWKMFVPEGAVSNNRYNVPTDGSNYYHPSFMYESVSNILLLILIAYLMRNGQNKTGLITGLFLFFYGIIRFGIEFFRLDSQVGLYNLTIGQNIAAIIIIIGVLLILTRKKKYADINL
jgi:phosphatidylglycerol---prolipoprotein diacylglyceryl transferase